MKGILELSPMMAAALIGTSLVTSEANALTAEDVMERMSQPERIGYIHGLVDMAAYQARLDGNEELAQCIAAWFYDSDEGPQTVWANLDAYSDHATEAILTLLIERECG